MKKNMGGTDRIIRLLVALIIGLLFWQGVIVGTFAYILLVVAAIFVLTSVISFCPLYTLVGLHTCKVNK